MHKLIAKYVQAYQQQEGSSTQKVKRVLMKHSTEWEWSGTDSLIADLLDDVNITGEDIVDFLSATYEYEGGNEEFKYAVQALQISLRKAHLASIVSVAEEEYFAEEETKEDGFDHAVYQHFYPGETSSLRYSA